MSSFLIRRPQGLSHVHSRSGCMAVAILLLMVSLVSCGSNNETAAEATPVPTTAPIGPADPTTTSTVAPVPTATPTDNPAATATAEVTPDPTVEPTATVAATPEPTPEPTAVPTPTAPPSPTATPTAVPSPSPTPTATSIATPLGSVITTPVGDEFVVSFELDPTSVFRWQIGELPPGSLLELVDDIYIGEYGGTAGPSAWQHFTLRGIDDGRATLNFWLTNSDGIPVERAQFDVVVGSGTPECSGVFEVAVGESFEIVLGSNSTTGYRWEISEEPTPGIVRLVSEHYVPPVTGAVGASGWQRFVFEGVADGETDLDFWYVRPFDSPPAPANAANFRAIVGSGIPGCSGVFTVEPGEDLEIALGANLSTGYRWELSEVPEPGVVSLVKEVYVPGATTSAGITGTQVFTFRGLDIGEVTLKFWYVRPFDNPPVPADRINFKAIVE